MSAGGECSRQALEGSGTLDHGRIAVKQNRPWRNGVAAMPALIAMRGCTTVKSRRRDQMIFLDAGQALHYISSSCIKFQSTISPDYACCRQ